MTGPGLRGPNASDGLRGPNASDGLRGPNASDGLRGPNPAAGLEVRGLSVRLGRHQAVRDVSVDVAAGTVVGVVGPNGAGKTTLVDAVSGFVPAYGAVRVGGRTISHLPPHRRAALGLARTFQGLELFEDLTVGENLAVAGRAARRTWGPEASPATGFEDVLDRFPVELSHGRRKQLALARALAPRPSVLLLDEPAAGLGRLERADLAATLRDLAAGGMAVVLVDHDMGLVLEVCDRVLVLDGGRALAHGPPDAVRSDPAVAAAWGLSGGSAQVPPERRRRPPVDPPSSPGKRLRRAGSAGLAMTGMSAGYDGVPAVSDLDLAVGAGEVVALLGANGAGKTTTLRAACGMLPPLAGEVTALGRPVTPRPDREARRGVAHATQDRGLIPGLTVVEQLRLAARSRNGRAAAAVLDRFPSLRPLLNRRAGLLSGGEQQLLSLARALASRPRLLLVDELSLGLAPELVHQALAALRALADEGDAAILLVEQFASLALSVADRGYVLDRGRVVLEGPAPELLSRPGMLQDTYLGGPRA